MIYLKLLGTNHVQIGKLFSRCLIQCKDIKLWNFYIEETKLVNKDNTELILQGYHFAIEHFGKHYKSAPLWVSYIEYVKTATVIIYFYFYFYLCRFFLFFFSSSSFFM